MYPILMLIILVIKQIGLLLRGRPILLIIRMITDRIGLHSVLLPLCIVLSAVTSINFYLGKFEKTKAAVCNGYC